MTEKDNLKISAGNFELNKWLLGGYDKDIITTIYGPAGAGKTNFCLMAAVSQARKNGKVIYIDTEGGFSIERFKQIVEAREKRDSKEKEIEWRKILENILILKPTSFEEQWRAFGRLLKEIKEDRESKISLIIVDGMTILYRLELAEAKENIEKIKEVNSVLARQMRLLAEISRKKNIPVLVTNQVYSEFLTDEERKIGKISDVKMVGGDILKYWSKCIIELRVERTGGSKRTAILRKHRSIAEKKLDFEVINEGIKKRGWI